MSYAPSNKAALRICFGGFRPRSKGYLASLSLRVHVARPRWLAENERCSSAERGAHAAKESGSLIASSHGIEAARQHLGHRDIRTTSSHYVDKKRRVEVSLPIGDVRRNSEDGGHRMSSSILRRSPPPMCPIQEELNRLTKNARKGGVQGVRSAQRIREVMEYCKEILEGLRQKLLRSNATLRSIKEKICSPMFA